MPGELSPLVAEARLVIKPFEDALKQLRGQIGQLNKDFAGIGAGARVPAVLQNIASPAQQRGLDATLQKTRLLSAVYEEAAKQGMSFADATRLLNISQFAAKGATQQQADEYNKLTQSVGSAVGNIKGFEKAQQQNIASSRKAADEQEALGRAYGEAAQFRAVREQKLTQDIEKEARQRIATQNKEIEAQRAAFGADIGKQAIAREQQKTAAFRTAVQERSNLARNEAAVIANAQQKTIADARALAVVYQENTKAFAQMQANARIAAQNLQQVFRFRPAAPGGAIPNFGNIQQIVTGPVAQLNKAITQAATTAAKVKIPPPPTPQYQQFSSILGTIASNFGRIATFSIAAGVIVRGFFEIVGAIRNTIAEGLRFNATLEEGKLALAGILGSTREVHDAQGKTVDLARAFPFLLQEAGKRQREILLANVETLGTGEELLAVYNQVLASTRGQKETEGDVLKASQVILDIMKLRGFAGEQIVNEGRQLFTAERAVGQTVAQTLGIRFQEQKALRDSGDLLHTIVQRGQIFLQLGKDLAFTWSGLTSTIQTFFSFIAGEAFKNTFLGVKEIFQGMIDALQEADARGGIPAALHISLSELHELGVVLGEFTVSFVTGLAGMTNRAIEWGANVHKVLQQLKQDFLDAAQGQPFSGRGIIPTVPTIPSAPIGGTKEDAEALRIVTSLLGEVVNGITIVKNAFSSLWADLKEQFTSGGNPINIWVAGVLAQGELLVSHFPALLKEAFAPPDIELQPRNIGALIGGFGAVSASLGDNARAFGNVADASKTAVDAVTVGWKIVNNALEPLPKTLAKIAAENVAVAQSAKRAADAQARLAEQIAEATGDAQKFLDARRAAITRETAVEIERAKKQGTLDRELTFIQIEDQVKRQEAVIHATEIIAAQEKKITDIINKQIELRAEAARGQVAARGIAVGADIANLELQLKLAQERNGTIAEQIDLTRKLGAAQVAEAQNALDLAQQELTAIQERIDALREEIKLHQSLLQARLAENDAIGASKEADQVRAVLDALQTELNKLPEAQVKIQAAIAGIGRATTTAANNLRQVTTITIHWGDVIRDSLKQVFNGLVAGTLKVKDAFRSLGLAIVGHITDAFATVIANKLGFDSTIKQNVGGIGGVFKSLGGGIIDFFGGALKAVGVDLTILGANAKILGLDILDLFKGVGSIGNVLKSAGGVFEGLGGLGAGLLGHFAGNFFSGLFKLNGSQEALIGGQILSTIGGIIGSVFGGPVGGFLGSFVGDLLGSFFGGLFAHIPTKGTQIRKAVINYLRSIDVEFADTLSSKKFGFQWAKQYAKEMNISFLEASKQFIPKNFPELVKQDLDKQLTALGVVLTEEIAKKLGKPVEQTAVTFANLIADNLKGIPKDIQAFIADTVEKTQASFEGMIEIINDVFKEGRISADLYKTAIEGVVGIFIKDFPKFIPVMDLINASMENGVLNVAKFKQALADVANLVNTVGQAAVNAFSQGIANNLSAQKVGEAFKTLVKDALRAAAIEKFVKDLLPDLFKDIDLSKPFTLGADAVDALRGRIEAAYERLLDLLRAANLLPDAFDSGNIGAAVADAFSKGITEGLTARQVGAAFEKMVRDALRAAAIDKFIREFLPTLFEGIDLSKPLDLSADAILRLQRKVEEGFTRLRAFLKGAGLLESVSDLVDKIAELNRQLVELAQKRIDIRVSLAVQLREIGAISAIEEADIRERAIRPRFEELTNRIGPIGTRPFGGLTIDELNEAIKLTEEMRDLVVARYQAEAQAIQDALRERIDAINEELRAQQEAIRAQFDARREAVRAVIDGLEKEKDKQRELFQIRLDALQKELSIAEEFQRVAESLKETIRGLVTGPQSTLTGPAQLAYLQRQAAAVRAKLATAKPEERPALIQELANILQQMLQTAPFQKPSPEYVRLFEAIVREIESLQRQAEAEGNKVGSIQQQILDTENAMKARLASIDAQIEAQQKLLSDLSKQEQAALQAAADAAAEKIKAAQKEAKEATDALRVAAVQKLVDLAILEDSLVQEQLRHAEAQKAVLLQQLTEQVGATEAAKLLAAGAAAQTLQLAAIDNSLHSIDTHLIELVNKIPNFTKAQHGFEGQVTRPRLFLAGERGPEYVSIRPHRNGEGVTLAQQRGGGDITFAPHIQVTMQNSNNPEQDGARLGRAISQAMIQEWRHGPFGTEVRREIRRN